MRPSLKISFHLCKFQPKVCNNIAEFIMLALHFLDDLVGFTHELQVGALFLGKSYKLLGSIALVGLDLE